MAIKSVKNKTRSGSLLIGNPPFIPTDFESIASVTVGSGGTATIDFTSIPSTYKHLQIRGIGRSTTGSTGTDYLLVRLNTDTGSNYAWHDLYGNGTTASSEGDFSRTNIRAGFLPRASQLANSFGVAIIDITDYASTSKTKTLRSFSGMEYNSASAPLAQVALKSGLWNSTSAVTSIRLYSEANNVAEFSSFTLYGIKG